MRLDLTPTNEASARALFAETFASNYMSSVYTGPDEGRAQARIDARATGLAAWDSGSVAHETLVQFRELALAVTLTTWEPIAAQAWVEGYGAGARDRAQNERNTREGRTDIIAETPNPYAREAGL